LQKRNASIVARARALLMQDLEDLQDHIKVRRRKKPAGDSTASRAGKRMAPEPPEIQSQSEIFELVAREFRVKSATVKRLFERDDREAGPFGFRVVRSKQKVGSIIDI
jgi:hypothetical protein